VAARTFSTGEDMERLAVLPCHVRYVEGFLEGEYSKPSVGYLRLSEAVRAESSLDEPDTVRRMLEALPFPRDAAQSMLRADSIEIQDVQDWCGWEHVEARQLVSALVRRRALARDGRAYRKTPPFVALLRSALETLQNKPGHITERARF